MSDFDISSLKSELDSLKSKVDSLGQQMKAKESGDPFHPHPHPHHGKPRTGDDAVRKDAQIVILMNDVNNIKLWRDSLQGQDGIVINNNVIGFHPPNDVRQKAVLTVCINGVPGYVLVHVDQPPAPL